MFIYIIGSKTSQKIGYSKDLKKRLSTLQTGNPEQLVLHHYVEVPEKKARLLEKKIHTEMSYLRIKGEWFNTTPENAKAQVDHAMIRWLDDDFL